MTEDLLKAATSALREEHSGEDAGANFTRARVMASMHNTRERSRKRWVLVLPIAATFAAATAFATSGRMPALVQSVAAVFGLAQGTESPAELPNKPTRAQRRVHVAPKAVPAPVTEPTPEPTVEPVAPETPTAPSATVTAARPTLNPAFSAALPDPSHALYLEAHRAHFERGEFARALPAWEDYLRKAPNGRFSLEARYNRAVCLVRLGRSAEARSALVPFASGQFGSYRRSEATALLDSLAP